MADVGTFTQYPALAELPPLVKRQRTLEGKIAPIAPLVDEEKAVRQQIDLLLRKAGIQKGDSVTCNGYDVGHHERKGQSSYNTDVLIALLEGAGLEKKKVFAILIEATETGDPALWASVKPSKGSKVRK